MDVNGIYCGDGATGLTLLDQYNKQMNQNDYAENEEEDGDDEAEEEEREKERELQELLQNASFDDVLDNDEESFIEQRQQDGSSHVVDTEQRNEFNRNSNSGSSYHFNSAPTAAPAAHQPVPPQNAPAYMASVSAEESCRESLGSVTNISTAQPNAYSTPLAAVAASAPLHPAHRPPPSPPAQPPVGEVFLSMDEKEFTLDHNTYLDSVYDAGDDTAPAPAPPHHHLTANHTITNGFADAQPLAATVEESRAVSDCNDTSRDAEQVRILYSARVRQVAELTHKLEQLEDDSAREIRVLKHQITLVQEEKDGYKSEIDELKASAINNHQEVSQLQTKIQECEDRYQKCEGEKKQLSSRLQGADANIAALHQELACLGDADAVRRLRQDLDRQREALEGKYERQLLQGNRRLDDATQQLQEKSAEVESVRRQLSELERAHERLKLEKADTVNHLNHRLEESQRQCSQQLVQHSGSYEEIGQLRAKLQLAEKENQKESYQRKLIEKQKSDLEEEIDILGKSLPNGGDSSNGKNKPETSGRSGMVHYLKLSQQQRQEIATLTQLLDEEGDRARELGAQCHAERRLIQQLQEKLKTAELELRSLSRSDDDNDDRRVTKHMEKTDIEKRLSQRESEKRVLENSVERLESRLAELEESEKQLALRNQTQDERLTTLLQQAQEDRDRDIHRCRDACESKIQSLTSEHQQELVKLAANLKSAESELHGAKQDYITLCKERNGLERTVEKCKAEAAQERLNERKKFEDERRKSLDELKARCMNEAEKGCKVKLKEEVDKQVDVAKEILREQQQREMQTAAREQEDRALQLQEKHNKELAGVKARFRQLQEKLRNKEQQARRLQQQQQAAVEQPVDHLHELYSKQMEDMRHKHQHDMSCVRDELRAVEAGVRGLHEAAGCPCGGHTEHSSAALTIPYLHARLTQLHKDRAALRAQMNKLNKTYLESLEKVKEHCCLYIDKNGESVKELLLKVSECERQRLISMITHVKGSSNNKR